MLTVFISPDRLVGHFRLDVRREILKRIEPEFHIRKFEQFGAQRGIASVVMPSVHPFSFRRSSERILELTKKCERLGRNCRPVVEERAGVHLEYLTQIDLHDLSAARGDRMRRACAIVVDNPIAVPPGADCKLGAHALGRRRGTFVRRRRVRRRGDRQPQRRRRRRRRRR